MCSWNKVPLAYLCLAGVLWAAEDGVWLDVPFVRQQKNGCGAASIAMVMQYWQLQQHQSDTPDLAQIERALASQKGNGTYASDLKRFLDDHNYQTFAFHGEWGDLKAHLEKGRPLIVALKPPTQSELHYVVVAGLDWKEDLVLTNDPAERKLLKRTRVDFENEWKATDNWTLLAVPREHDSVSSTR